MMESGRKTNKKEQGHGKQKTEKKAAVGDGGTACFMGTARVTIQMAGLMKVTLWMVTRRGMAK